MGQKRRKLPQNLSFLLSPLLFKSRVINVFFFFFFLLLCDLQHPLQPDN